jgi:hypothetical protein
MKIAETLMMWTTWGIRHIEKCLLKQAFLNFFENFRENLIFLRKVTRNHIHAFSSQTN